MRPLEHRVQPTSEGGQDNIWTGVTPDWCPINNERKTISALSALNNADLDQIAEICSN